MVSPNASAASAASRLSPPPGRTRSSPRISSGASGASGASVRFSTATNRMSGRHRRTTAPPPSRSPALSLASKFTSVISAKGGSSVSSLSQSTRKSTPSRNQCSAAAIAPPPSIKKTRFSSTAKYATASDALQNYDDHDDDGHESPDDSQPPDKDADYVPITAAAADDVSSAGRKKIAGVHSLLVEKHREIFMARAFPPNQDDEGDGMLLCRPQSELDYIAHVVTNWQAGIQVKEMEKGPERDRLAQFRKQNPKGNKYKDLFHVEEILVPGSDTPRTVIRRVEKGNIGRIVVSRETVFDAIDEWHRQNGHMGQERTWGYCREKYFNCTQSLVRIYCETCFTCMQKNPATKAQKGSRKPIRSRSFRERFQIDLIDFRKLRKRDPFGVLMRWILTVKDHATSFVYLCALPRKRPSLVAYRLQEIFGVMGYPMRYAVVSTFGKEFSLKN